MAVRVSKADFEEKVLNESLPVPPAINVSSLTPFLIKNPPIPNGPYGVLCPAKT